MTTSTVLQGLTITKATEPFVHQEFERHAARFPDRTAVTAGERSLTYRQLDDQANRLAQLLLGRGIGRGDVVGICMDRTPALVVALIGVLKAGAAYVPLDASYPQDRLRRMVEQLPGLSLVCCTADTEEMTPRDRDTLVMSLDGSSNDIQAHTSEKPHVTLSPEDLCYVVFTSGSTGTPKAVSVRHRGWHNLLTWLVLEYGLDDTAHNLVVSSFGFDITQRSLLTPLFCGARLDLLPSRSFDAAMAYRIISTSQVRTLHCPPSLLYLLTDRDSRREEDGLRSLRYVFIGGEALTIARVESWARGRGHQCTLLHQYGVSECTDVATSHVLADYDRYADGHVPVGTPVYNTAIHILDDDLRDVERGETGEVCISGAGVGAGYLGASETSEARFTVVDREGAALAIYRTGDRGFITADDELVVVGRTDSQVKIRGNRIDLGDVDYALRRNSAVRDAAVVAVANDAGELDLVAFVISADSDFDPRRLREDLHSSIPKAMIPARFIETSEFPMTPNNKVDRKALVDAASVRF